MSIIPLTHVCRYWRESIISTPENWTLISCKNEDMTAVSLKRAKAAPLEITVHMDTGAPSPDLLSPHLHNTRTLAVSFPPAIGELTEVFPNFPQSIPTLRSLRLVWVWDVDRDRTIDPFESFVPPLQHLYLAGIPLYPSLLGLRTLTEVTIRFSRFDFHLDTLLDFLEGNPSLESATLDIHFLNPSLLSSQRKTAMKNNLRHLYIDCDEKVDVQALLSSIPLRRGADLDVIIRDELQHATLDSFLPEISSAHLSNPPLPTFFRLGHIIRCREIKLGGPGGSISFHGLSWLGVSFADFAVLPLSDVREPGSYSQTPGVLSVIFSRPRDTNHQLQCPCAGRPLSLAVEFVPFPISENHQVSQLRSLRRSYEEINEIRFRASEHSHFNAIASRSDRP